MNETVRFGVSNNEQLLTQFDKLTEQMKQKELTDRPSASSLNSSLLPFTSYVHHARYVLSASYSLTVQRHFFQQH